TDLSLAADQSALYAADYGGTNIGYGTPSQPSFVHRYDLASRTWERCQAPKIAFHIEAVDDSHFLLLEQDQWVNTSVNEWPIGGKTIHETARAGTNFAGDVEYDPRTGRLYHGNSGISSPEVHVYRVRPKSIRPIEDTGTYGTAKVGG